MKVSAETLGDVMCSMHKAEVYMKMVKKRFDAAALSDDVEGEELYIIGSLFLMAADAFIDAGNMMAKAAREDAR